MSSQNTVNENAVKKDRKNPWPTAEQRIGRLQTVLWSDNSARLFWQTLGVADRNRLGGRLEEASDLYGRTIGMWIKLRSVTPYRAILDVAHLLEMISDGEYERLLESIGEQGDDLEARVRCAVASNRLVLVESRHQIYFDGELIPIDWRRYASKWTFLIKLIQNAPRKRPVYRHDINAKTLDLSYLSKLASDMSCLGRFPPELKDLIVGAGNGSYLLKLDAAEIGIVHEAG